MWGEVDLRWGVTDEQKAEGAVLPICLAEIERTRPYFIGMLGERYGWVPDEIPRDLADREAWLADDTGRSVTEMEILHGVLREPGDGRPRVLLPPRPGLDDVAARGRARDLRGGVGRGPRAPRRPQGARARHRASRCATTPTRAASATSCAPICSRSSTSCIRPPRRPDALEQARIDQEAYAAWLVGNTIERRADLVAVDVAVDADGPGVVVSGAPGGGVSTLLAAYAAERRERHPDELVISYFVDAQRGEASERELLAYLCRALGDDGARGRPARPRADAARAGLRDAPRRARDRRPAPDRGGRRRRRLAAVAAARRAALVAGTRPGATVAWLVQRGLGRVDLQQFDAAQRQLATTTFLRAYSKGLDRPLIERIAGRRAVRQPAAPAHRAGRAAPARRPLHAAAAARLAARAGRPRGPRRGRARPLRARLRARLARPGRRGAGPARGVAHGPHRGRAARPARRRRAPAAVAAAARRGQPDRRLRRPPAAGVRPGAGRGAAPLPGRRARRCTAGSPRCSPPIRARRAPSRSCPGSCSPPATPSSSARCWSIPRSSRRRTTRDANLLARLWARLEETSSFRAATAYAPFARHAAGPRDLDRDADRGPVRRRGGGAGAAPRGRRRAAPATTRRATCRPRSPTSRAAQHGVGDLAAALATLDELDRTLAGGGAVELRIALHQNRGVVLRHLGRPTRRCATWSEAEALAREAGRPGDVQTAAGERAGVLAETGRIPEALEATAIQVDAATESGEAPARMRALLTRAPLLFQTNDIAGAARATAEGEFIARDLGDLEWLATALTLHVQLRSWENRLDLARDQLTELIAVRERLGQHDVVAQLRAFQAQMPDGRQHRRPRAPARHGAGGGAGPGPRRPRGLHPHLHRDGRASPGAPATTAASRARSATPPCRSTTSAATSRRCRC